MRTSVVVERPGEVRAPDGLTGSAPDLAGSVHADVAQLLVAYHGALALAYNPPSSLSLPRRLRSLHLRLRPMWGAHESAARHVRRSLDALERNFARRLAIGEADDNDARDRQAVREFRDSLPAPTSRLVVVGLFIAAAVLAQKLLDALTELLDGIAVRDRGRDALAELGPSPSVTSIQELLDTILNSSVVELSIFAAAVCWGVYLVCRPLACGYRLANLALGRVDGLGTPRRRHAELVVKARRLAAHDKEAALFATLGSPPPREFPYDLVVKALLCTPLLILIGGFVKLSIEQGYLPTEAPVFAAMFALVACRLLVLGHASRKRGRGTTWLVLPLPLVALACLAPPVYPPDPKDPNLGRSQSQSLRLTLSTHKTSSALSYPGRDLRQFYVYRRTCHTPSQPAPIASTRVSRERRLSDAQPHSATPVAASLRRAILNGTSAYTDLRHTHLRETNSYAPLPTWRSAY